jgi:hypothetical protein
MFTSVQGSFASLLSNPKLNYLVGDIKTVTSEDEEDVETKKNIHEKKSKRVRCGLPVFDIIVELSPQDSNTWRIIKDVGASVDKALVEKVIKVELRTFNPGTSGVVIKQQFHHPKYKWWINA